MTAAAKSPDGLAAVGAMDREAFTGLLGGVFEHSPWVAGEAWEARPFATVDALHRAMTGAVTKAGAERKLALIRAHPELSGKEAEAGTLTGMSVDEQAGAGLDALAPGDVERMRALNAGYREKFGFPFIIAVRRHSRDSIFDEFERRLANDRETEIGNNLEQIFAIARMRLDDLVVAGR